MNSAQGKQIMWLKGGCWPLAAGVEGETREGSFLKMGSLTGKWDTFSQFRVLPHTRLSALHTENAH